VALVQKSFVEKRLHWYFANYSQRTHGNFSDIHIRKQSASVHFMCANKNYLY